MNVFGINAPQVLLEFLLQLTINLRITVKSPFQLHIMGFQIQVQLLFPLLTPFSHNKFTVSVILVPTTVITVLKIQSGF